MTKKTFTIALGILLVASFAFASGQQEGHRHRDDQHGADLPGHLRHACQAGAQGKRRVTGGMLDRMTGFVGRHIALAQRVEQ